MADPQPTDPPVSDKTAAQVETTLNTDNNHALFIFAGAGVLTIVFAVLGIWIKEFIAASVSGFAALLGAATMYLKGK